MRPQRVTCWHKKHCSLTKKTDLTDFDIVNNAQQAIKVRSENNEKAVKTLKNLKTTVNTKFAKVDKDIGLNKTKIAEHTTKIISMDAKIKTGIDKPEILNNYKFMIGRNFFYWL